MQHVTFTTQPGLQQTTFNFWAPDCSEVSLELSEEGKQWSLLKMHSKADGWFSLTAPASAGTYYRYRIGELSVPDPASRYQPHDVHGPSQVMDPNSYPWQTTHWQGRPWHEYIIYELHIGTFTAEGTYQAARERIPELADLGITAIELMPLSDFPGKRNWGYDGVLPYAPDSSYGHPDDLKALIDSCHHYGIAVILDVVYNHFGPDGNYLGQYASPFFTEHYHTPWGAAINLDGEHSTTVREFFIQNIEYWRDEFRIDGFRIDAAHCLFDDSPTHFFTELSERLQTTQRHYPLLLENENNAAKWLPGPAHPAACTAQWNDDFHHAVHVLLTGEQAGYYLDYQHQPLALLGKALTQGFIYQGEISPHLGKPRGESSQQLQLSAFVNHIQNHDQVGNRAFGERISALAQPAQLRLLTEVWLLCPAIPMFFMGQEYNEPQPFLFFCDYPEPLATAVREGRRNEFASFPAFKDPQQRAQIPDPCAQSTFTRSKLTWFEDAPEAMAHHALIRKLLGIRKEWIAPRAQHITVKDSRYQVDGPLLTVSWPLDDGHYLWLRCNFSEQPQASSFPAAHQLIYTSSTLAPDNTHIGPYGLQLSVADTGLKE